MPTDPLAPARRASLTMFVLGGLGLACGLCFGAAVTLSFDQIMAQQGALPPLPPGVTYALLQKILIAFAAVALIANVALIALGLFVRKGSAPASTIGIVLTSLFVLYFGGNSILALVGPYGPVAALVSLVITAVYGMQLYFLVQALRASSNVKHMQAAYQAQYWQYMQQQQTYNAAAYNQNAYNAPPAGPAQPGPSQTGWQWPAPPPPPGDAPQNPPSQGGPHGQSPQ